MRLLRKWMGRSRVCAAAAVSRRARPDGRAGKIEAAAVDDAGPATVHAEARSRVAPGGAACESDEVAAAAHVAHARTYLAQREIEEARDNLEVAVALDPCNGEALVKLAALLREAGEAGRGLELLERAYGLAPHELATALDYASALNHAGQTGRAIEVYEDAIRDHPHDAAARVNLGLVCLQQLSEPVRAERLFREAVERAPTLIPALSNLGLALRDQGRLQEELEHYRRCLGSFPGAVELQWNLALAHLSRGDYAQGWPGYELRRVRKGGRNFARFPFADWDGAAVEGTLLVLAEQGIGDEVMFASCLEDVRCYASRIVVECAPRLQSLFARSFPDLHVHGMERTAPLDWLNRYPDIAAKTAIGSLPLHLRSERDRFPAKPGYLRADSALVQRYRDSLRSGDGTPTIGLSWNAGSLRTRGAMRSAGLDAMGALLGAAHCRFVCLQFGLNEREQQAARSMGLAIFPEALDHVEHTAALIAALDLVVTVDNTNAHLCGALGRPGWVLLTDSPDWRWRHEGDESPWYPSLTLLRKERGTGWPAFVERIGQRLQARVAAGPGGTR